MLAAIETDWDRNTTDSAFKLMERILLKKKRKLEKYSYIPTSGSNLCIFIENIESFSKKDTEKNRFFFTSRPKENYIFYTCKTFQSIPEALRMVTDFFFMPLTMKNGKMKTMIFSNGYWIEKLKNDVGRDYIKTIYSKIENGELKVTKEA